MFLLVPAHPGCPGQNQLSHKTVVYVFVCVLKAVGPFRLPASHSLDSGTRPRISSGTRRSVQTVSDVHTKRIRSLTISAFSALEVLDDNCAT